MKKIILTISLLWAIIGTIYGQTPGTFSSLWIVNSPAQGAITTGTGSIRFNAATNKLQLNENGVWKDILTNSDFWPLSGNKTLTGNLDISGSTFDWRFISDNNIIFKSIDRVAAGITNSPDFRLQASTFDASAHEVRYGWRVVPTTNSGVSSSLNLFSQVDTGIESGIFNIESTGATTITNSVTNSLLTLRSAAAGNPTLTFNQSATSRATIQWDNSIGFRLNSNGLIQWRPSNIIGKDLSNTYLRIYEDDGSTVLADFDRVANNLELFGDEATNPFGLTTPGDGVLRLNDVGVAPVGTLGSGGLIYVNGTDLLFHDDTGTSTVLNSSNFITPESFGAAGDGVTDDATAIQNAVNSGSPVLFGNKTYLVSSTINVPAQSTLVGTGLSILKTNSVISILELNGNTRVSDMTFEGNDGVLGQNGIFIDDTALPLASGKVNNFITNCLFRDFHSGMWLNQVSNGTTYASPVKVTNCTFTSNNFGVAILNRAEYSTFSNCTWNENTTGIRVDGANNVFIGGTVTANGTGIQLRSAANPGKNRFTGMLINHNTVNAIDCASVAKGFFFESCSFFTTANYLITGTTDARFLNCTFSSATAYTITSTNNTRLEFAGCKFIAQTPSLNITGSNPLWFRNTFDVGSPAIVENTISQQIKESSDFSANYNDLSLPNRGYNDARYVQGSASDFWRNGAMTNITTTGTVIDATQNVIFQGINDGFTSFGGYEMRWPAGSNSAIGPHDGTNYIWRFYNSSNNPTLEGKHLFYNADLGVGASDRIVLDRGNNDARYWRNEGITNLSGITTIQLGSTSNNISIQADEGTSTSSRIQMTKGIGQLDLRTWNNSGFTGQSMSLYLVDGTITISDEKTVKTGLRESADYSSGYNDLNYTNKGYVDSRINGKTTTTIDALNTNTGPGATEDGYSLVWNNSANEYILSEIISATVTGAGNGLSLDGNNIQLGNPSAESLTNTINIGATTGTPYDINLTPNSSDVRLQIGDADFINSFVNGINIDADGSGNQIVLSNIGGSGIQVVGNLIEYNTNIGGGTGPRDVLDRGNNDLRYWNTSGTSVLTGNTVIEGAGNIITFTATPRTTAGITNSPDLTLAASSYDTQERDINYIWRAIPNENSGINSDLRLVTQRDGGLENSILNINSSGNLEVGTRQSTNPFGSTTPGTNLLRLGDVGTTPVGTLGSGGLIYVNGTDLLFHDDTGTSTVLNSTSTSGWPLSGTESLTGNVTVTRGTNSLNVGEISISGTSPNQTTAISGGNFDINTTNHAKYGSDLGQGSSDRDILDRGNNDERYLRNLTSFTISVDTFNIDEWNMDVATGIGVNKTVTNSLILDIQVMIENDTGSNWYPLNRYNPGSSNIDGGISLIGRTATTFVVNIDRRTGGFFDSTSFDDGTKNRGWLIVRYIP